MIHKCSLWMEWNLWWFSMKVKCRKFHSKNSSFEHLENILKDEENIWMFENFAKGCEIEIWRNDVYIVSKHLYKRVQCMKGCHGSRTLFGKYLNEKWNFFWYWYNVNRLTHIG